MYTGSIDCKNVSIFDTQVDESFAIVTKATRL